MKLILTVNHIDHAFALYDPESEVVEFQPYVDELEDQRALEMDKNPMRPYGITTDDKHIYLASHRRIGQFDKRTLEYKGLHPIETDINTHQLTFFRGKLVVANTHNHGLSICSNGVTAFFDIISDRFVIEPDRPDIKQNDGSNYFGLTVHVNSLTVYDDHLYVSIRSVITNTGVIKVYDRNFTLVDTIRLNIVKMHNLHVDEHHIYTLCSSKHVIYKVDRTKQKFTMVDRRCQSIKLDLPDTYYLRGMQYHDGKLYMMASLHPATYYTTDVREPALMMIKDGDDLTIQDIPSIVTPISDIHVLT